MVGYIRQAWLVLGLALLFGVALAGVDAALKPRILENARVARIAAAQEVVPGGAAVTEVPALPNVLRVDDAQGRLMGWAVEGSGQGYADTIRVLFGLTPDGQALTGLVVLYNQETPGLGNKITEYEWRKQFLGQPTDAELVPVTRHSGQPREIDAVTGATISSQAVCTIINQQTLEPTPQGLAPSRLIATLADLAEQAQISPDAPAPGGRAEPLPVTPDDVSAYTGSTPQKKE